MNFVILWVEFQFTFKLLSHEFDFLNHRQWWLYWSWILEIDHYPFSCLPLFTNLDWCIKRLYSILHRIVCKLIPSGWRNLKALSELKKNNVICCIFSQSKILIRFLLFRCSPAKCFHCIIANRYLLSVEFKAPAAVCFSLRLTTDLISGRFWTNTLRKTYRDSYIELLTRISKS